MSDIEDSVKNFINTVIFVSRIFSGLKDKFLARKLYNKLSDFIAAYIAQRGFSNINVAKSGYIVQHRDVAQYSQLDIKVATDSLLDLLDYLEHSKAVVATPLSYARRSLFALKLQLIRIQPKQHIVKKERAASRAAPKINLRPELRSREKEINLSGNKEKILNYIKRSPDSRTKDIIYEFSVLSGRTVKRNLKELVDDGLLKKVSKDKAIYYHTI